MANPYIFIGIIDLGCMTSAARPTDLSIGSGVHSTHVEYTGKKNFSNR